MSKTRKAMSVLGLVGVIAFSSACSGGAGDTDNATPEPEATAAVSAAASESPAPAETQDANIIDGVPVKEGTVSDGVGEYRQTTITDDDPAMKYNPSKATELAKTNFTPEELAAVQKKSIRFLAEEGLDSTANGTDEAAFQEWWDRNESVVHPSYKEVLYNAEIGDPKEGGIVLRSTWWEGKYGFDYSEQTRIKNRDISLMSIDSGNAPDGQPFVSIRTNVAFQSPIIVQGREAAESVVGTTVYTWLKDTADGEWKIAGYNVNYNGEEAPREW